VWTLDQQAAYVKQGIWPLAGLQPNYIEDVFSTWLYPSIGGDNQIINNIDLSTNNGLVWIKSRSRVTNHYLIDTVRGSSLGNTKSLSSNTATVQTSGPNLDYLQFNNNGFTAKAVTGGGELGTNPYYGNMASWTFREQPKFFDIVTYTGNGTAGRTIAHNLSSVPGCIIVKRLDTTSDWSVYHRSLGATQGMTFNSSYFAYTASSFWNNTAPTSTVFTVGTDSTINASGGTYVAYLWAHDAGGFGLLGADNVISCGSFTTDGSGNATVNIGYEPQFVIAKGSSASGDSTYWNMHDSMRGFNLTSVSLLQSNTTASENNAAGGYFSPTATGFTTPTAGLLNASTTYIYIAIRRGPMKVPTDATKVFSPVTQTSTGSAQAVTTNFPVDFTLSRVRGSTSANYVIDRLRGSTSASARILISNTTDAEYSGGPGFSFDSNTQITDNGLYGAGSSVIYECFRRAPGFFDEVCYTGNDTARTLSHNLAAVPELMIVKQRDNTGNWAVYTTATAATNVMYLNTTNASFGASGFWNNTAPTASVFTIGNNGNVNNATSTYVAYLFATCPGVSKVGSYTGNGTTQAIACGFTGGARFVLIKRTDSTGDWYVYDTARGMTTLTDPYLLLNTTAAESATLGSVTTTAGGFTVDAAILAAINTNAASYLFFAVS
jgi:hypothetical protein